MAISRFGLGGFARAAARGARPWELYLRYRLPEAYESLYMDPIGMGSSRAVYLLREPQTQNPLAVLKVARTGPLMTARGRPHRWMHGPSANLLETDPDIIEYLIPKTFAHDPDNYEWVVKEFIRNDPRLNRSLFHNFRRMYFADPERAMRRLNDIFGFDVLEMFPGLWAKDISPRDTAVTRVDTPRGFRPYFLDAEIADYARARIPDEGLIDDIIGRHRDFMLDLPDLRRDAWARYPELREEYERMRRMKRNPAAPHQPPSQIHERGQSPLSHREAEAKAGERTKISKFGLGGFARAAARGARPWELYFRYQLPEKYEDLTMIPIGAGSSRAAYLLEDPETKNPLAVLKVARTGPLMTSRFRPHRWMHGPSGNIMETDPRIIEYLIPETLAYDPENYEWVVKEYIRNEPELNRELFRGFRRMYLTDYERAMRRLNDIFGFDVREKFPRLWYGDIAPRNTLVELRDTPRGFKAYFSDAEVADVERATFPRYSLIDRINVRHRDFVRDLPRLRRQAWARYPELLEEYVRERMMAKPDDPQLPLRFMGGGNPFYILRRYQQQQAKETGFIRAPGHRRIPVETAAEELKRLSGQQKTTLANLMSSQQEEMTPEDIERILQDPRRYAGIIEDMYAIYFGPLGKMFKGMKAGGSIEDAFEDAQRKFPGLPRNLLRIIAQVESGMNPKARSPKGALGLMQFMPKTAEQYGIDPLNPIQSIYAAGMYLSGLLRRFGSLPLALAAYNWGPGNLMTYGPERAPKETIEYVRKVLAMLGDSAKGTVKKSLQAAVSSDEPEKSSEEKSQGETEATIVTAQAHKDEFDESAQEGDDEEVVRYILSLLEEEDESSS